MSVWGTYQPEDFLLFSPRVYWRLFELHNQAAWPLHGVVLAFAVLLLAVVFRPRPWGDRAVALGLALAWVAVASSFFWTRYATINWAAKYVAPAFVIEGALLFLLGVVAHRLSFGLRTDPPGIAGAAVFLYALILHPLTAVAAGRPLAAAEVFAIAPDPTAMGTLGLLSMVTPRGLPAWVLLPIPVAWCLTSWATLQVMGAPEAWIPLAAVAIVIASRLWPRRAAAIPRGR